MAAARGRAWKLSSIRDVGIEHGSPSTIRRSVSTSSAAGVCFRRYPPPDLLRRREVGLGMGRDIATRASGSAVDAACRLDAGRAGELDVHQHRWREPPERAMSLPSHPPTTVKSGSASRHWTTASKIDDLRPRGDGRHTAAALSRDAEVSQRSTAYAPRGGPRSERRVSTNSAPGRRRAPPVAAVRQGSPGASPANPAGLGRT